MNNKFSYDPGGDILVLLLFRVGSIVGLFRICWYAKNQIKFEKYDEINQFE